MHATFPGNMLYNGLVCGFVEVLYLESIPEVATIST